MMLRRNTDGQLQTLLHEHADLIVHGDAQRAADVAKRASEPDSASLFEIAETLRAALTPVPPDPGFRLHLRDLLECPESNLAVLDDHPPLSRSGWSRLTPTRLVAWRRRGSDLVPSPAAASKRTRRLISSLAAASVVGIAAAWGIGRVLRRAYVGPRHNTPATGSAGPVSST